MSEVMGRGEKDVFSFYIALAICGIGVLWYEWNGMVCGVRGLVGKGMVGGRDLKGGGVEGKGTAQVLFCSALRRK